MIDHIAQNISNAGGSSSKPLEDIERYHGWQGHLSMEEVSKSLKGQAPYTYAITKSDSGFLLSFVRSEDHSIVHIQFNETKDGKWTYMNGYINIEPRLDQIIKRMMHWDSSMPEPTPLF